MDVKVGTSRQLSTEELMLLNCGVGEDSWESLCKIKPVNPKGNQSWTFIGRTETEAEAPILWPHDGKNWLIRKDPDVGRDWRLEEKGMTENEMVGWHHWLNGHKFEQALKVGDGQGSLACCSPWVVKSWTWLSDWTKPIAWPYILQCPLFFFFKIFFLMWTNFKLLNLLQYCFCFKFCYFGPKACGILVPRPRIELVSLALESKVNHWTAREVPQCPSLTLYCQCALGLWA